jgi:dynein heavy chain
VGFPGATSLHTIYSTFLEGHLKTFPEEVQQQCNNLLSSALALQTGMTSTFRKSAINFHYEFNIRHLSNVFQGLLQSQPNEFKTVEKLAQLWLHESERVYGDRLVSVSDLKKYKELALEQAKKFFKEMSPTTLFAEPLIFCHFAQGVGDKIYDKVSNFPDLSGLLNGALAEYNESHPVMNLVLFDQAMAHVARIARIIEMPRGNPLLIGVGGSGKQSLARLAAFIAGYDVFQVSITKSYNLSP